MKYSRSFTKHIFAFQLRIIKCYASTKIIEAHVYNIKDDEFIKKELYIRYCFDNNPITNEYLGIIFVNGKYYTSYKDAINYLCKLQKQK